MQALLLLHQLYLFPYNLLRQWTRGTCYEDFPVLALAVMVSIENDLVLSHYLLEQILQVVRIVSLVHT